MKTQMGRLSFIKGCMENEIVIKKKKNELLKSVKRFNCIVRQEKFKDK